AWRRNCPGVLGNLYGAEELDDVGNVDQAPAVTVAEIVEARTEALEAEGAPEDPSDDADPEWDATEGPPDDPEYDMQDVFRALWKRMQGSTPPWGWQHLSSITGWPEGAGREAGVRALLTDAIGSEDELAGMVFSALEATRS
ncbi:hypothetical protein LCGC14_1783390, partial [marine sediment metagenome]